jgi:hypothetical protein
MSAKRKFVGVRKRVSGNSRARSATFPLVVKPRELFRVLQEVGEQLGIVAAQ